MLTYRLRPAPGSSPYTVVRPRTSWDPYRGTRAADGYMPEGRNDIVTLSPSPRSRRFSSRDNWLTWLRTAAGPVARPRASAALAGRPVGRPRLSEDERKWMRVCVAGFRYRDEYGVHEYFPGVSFVAPDSDPVRRFPQYFGPSDTPYGRRTAALR